MRIKRMLSLLLAAAMTAAALGCTAARQNTGAQNAVEYPKAIAYEDYEAQWAVRDENPVRDETVAALNAFAYNSAAALLQAAEANQNYSPLSLAYALTLLTSGAAGQTQSQLLQALCATDAGERAAELGRLLRRLYADNEAARLKIANSLWMRPDTVFHDAFLKTATDELYAGLFAANFTTDDAAKRMEAWIRDNTSNLDPQITTDPEQILAILNTIDFRSAWVEEFYEDNNQTRDFHEAGGGTVQAEFMVKQQDARTYWRGEGFARAQLGLADGGRMVFVLPDEGTALFALASDPAALEAALAGGEERLADITYRIPKFSFDSEFDLIPLLRTLGVETAFSREDADFSAMTSLPAYVTQVKQQTHIDVNEQGVAASAFTMIAAVAGAMPPEDIEQLDFTLDRPFLYAIYASGGALLFVGAVYTPVQ